jgi:hypothetical protein
MAKNEERWRELCALAAVEQDPKKLMELVREITRLLELRDARPSRETDLEDNGEPDAKQTTEG